ncbi:MAG: 3-oxoacyl-ACP reductase FabG [Deltaproteobacteria bacterium]|nr:3-oxoacyl-ACP reductase FabG [Deltaproteobacteria bacterium]MBW2051942.1 3-oxoacyl-ACP reductase FabG [Deltaproteobacteria bacterium]MBW2139897.1 3-oxoacyl-ACP reductase FabG [Deltaproteobacteria bacterium]MBW2322475.1 3-oxoacyl-ACP reductase FabG [Deltaproteobacteria bacterium]
MEADSKAQKLKGRVALITGAGRGIGRAIAIQFADEGADLFLCATRMETLEETQELAARSGQQIELYPTDVADRDAVSAMVQKTIDSFGQIDILVNNAGIYKRAAFVDYSYEDFDRIMKVNLYGPFNVTQFVLKHMIERKKGKIINIASTAGKWASFGQSAYNVSKHGLVGMTRCLGLEMGPVGINVNAICPGVVETDMLTQFGPPSPEVLNAIKQRIALGRLMKPEDVAFLAAYLASSESDGMTGQSILLDGGMVFV